MVADVIGAILAYPQLLLKVHTDFTQMPWWDIVLKAAAARNNENNNNNDDIDTQQTTEDGEALAATLRTICIESSGLLRETWDLLNKQQPGIFIPNHKDDDAVATFMTPLWFGRIIGSFEQNAMGIRNRHPISCRELYDATFREQHHEILLDLIAQARAFDIEDDQDDNTDAKDNWTCEDSACNDDDDCKDPDCDDHGCDDDDCEDEHYKEDHCKDEHCKDEHCKDPDCDNHDDNDRGCNNPTCDDSDCADEYEDGIDNADKTPAYITNYLADLVHDESGIGDDMDRIIPPLDGSAMYSTTCKMNHSCDPNVVVLYRSHRWGEPLVSHCVALREIEEGEELCISYINEKAPLEERQNDLMDNYGFQCACTKCVVETEGGTTTEVEIQNDDFGTAFDGLDGLFGPEDDDDDDDDDSEDKAGEAVGVNDPASMVGIESSDHDPTSPTEMDGMVAMRKELDQKLNESMVGALPLPIQAEASTFAIRVCSSIFNDEQVKDNFAFHTQLKDCRVAVESKDFVGAASAGEELECELYKVLLEHGSFPSITHREAYGCASVVAAMGLSHTGNYMCAQRFLDKAMILGVPRQRIPTLCQYVEHFAASMAKTPLPPAFDAVVPDFQSLEKVVLEEGLSNPIQYPIDEVAVDAIGDYQQFETQYVRTKQAVVVRGYTSSWPATTKWR